MLMYKIPLLGKKSLEQNSKDFLQKCSVQHSRENSDPMPTETVNEGVCKGNSENSGKISSGGNSREPVPLPLRRSKSITYPPGFFAYIKCTPPRSRTLCDLFHRRPEESQNIQKFKTPNETVKNNSDVYENNITTTKNVAGHNGQVSFRNTQPNNSLRVSQQFKRNFFTPVITENSSLQITTKHQEKCSQNDVLPHNEVAPGNT